MVETEFGLVQGSVSVSKFTKINRILGGWTLCNPSSCDAVFVIIVWYPRDVCSRKMCVCVWKIKRINPLKRCNNGILVSYFDIGIVYHSSTMKFNQKTDFSEIPTWNTSVHTAHIRLNYFCVMQLKLELKQRSIIKLELELCSQRMCAMDFSGFCISFVDWRYLLGFQFSREFL